MNQSPNSRLSPTQTVKVQPADPSQTHFRPTAGDEATTSSAAYTAAKVQAAYFGGGGSSRRREGGGGGGGGGGSYRGGGGGGSRDREARPPVCQRACRHRKCGEGVIWPPPWRGLERRGAAWCSLKKNYEVQHKATTIMTFSETTTSECSSSVQKNTKRALMAKLKDEITSDNETTFSISFPCSM